MDNMRFGFPAARGQQGGRTFYTACIPFGMLARLLAIDTGNVLDRSQRAVDPKRAKAISQYILDNIDSFVLPALTGVVEDETLIFNSADEKSPVGELSLSMDAVIKLFDGQHRATGIMAALKEQYPALKSQQVNVQLFVNMTLADRQQAFSDINANAKAVSTSLNMVYDKRNDAVLAIADQINKVTAWEGRIDHENNVAKAHGCLFSFRHAVQASRLVLGLSAKQSPDEFSVNDISNWWNIVTRVVGWDIADRIAETKDDKKCIEIREAAANSLAFTAAGLMTLGRVFHLLKCKYGLRIDFYKVERALKGIDWNKSAEMWRGNLIDESGNMKSGTAGQIAAAELIVEVIASFLECM
ncbi:DNA sulfur modification protein DndB [Rheinheimera texasensis]|uniref:DNA sulfur modification protein DndB n=1 Tax=Rheinheimera texasensis TaxID=306205 RepID=UPI0032B0F72E